MGKHYVHNAKELIINIYVIGYKKEGESIYVRINTDDNEYCFDFLIDCYLNKKNRSLELLNGIKEENFLNIICLSHYHDDHIKDIDTIIDKYSKKDTKLLIPNVDNDEKLTPIAKKVRSKISNLRRYGRTNNGSIMQITDPRGDILEDSLELKEGNHTIRLEAISPFSDISIKNIENNVINLNDYSIALLLSIDNLKFLFTGDIMNDTIDLLDGQGDISYIKIPHHGSLDSNKMFKKINVKENSVCVSTNYINSKLPNREILNQYKEHTEDVYVTYKDNIQDYGIVNTKYIIDLESGKVRYNTRCESNSQKYEKQEMFF